MRALITGAAGFIGTNLAKRLLEEGNEVILLDNLSRAGSNQNLTWLQASFSEAPFERVDIREREALEATLREYGPLDAVFHLAAQVAVTSSIDDPMADFETNALGTLNLLEAVRSSESDPVVLFSSTNKVYGSLSDLQVYEDETRYRFRKIDAVSEETPLDLYSPYGCSKGAADQYVRDYHRTYGMRTIVFRNSCIYGPRQFGLEDQGWVAWFVINALQRRPITIYGDGKQVRDLLFIDDLVDAMLQAVDRIEVTEGQIYNIGGGPSNSVSVWAEFGPMLAEILGEAVPAKFAEWRLGDQKVYVSDLTKSRQDFDWEPAVAARAGLEKLVGWVSENAPLFTRAAG